MLLRDLKPSQGPKLGKERRVGSNGPKTEALFKPVTIFSLICACTKKKNFFLNLFCAWVQSTCRTQEVQMSIIIINILGFLAWSLPNKTTH